MRRTLILVQRNQFPAGRDRIVVPPRQVERSTQERAHVHVQRIDLDGAGMQRHGVLRATERKQVNPAPLQHGGVVGVEIHGTFGVAVGLIEPPFVDA